MEPKVLTNNAWPKGPPIDPMNQLLIIIAQLQLRPKAKLNAFFRFKGFGLHFECSFGPRPILINLNQSAYVDFK